MIETITIEKRPPSCFINKKTLENICNFFDLQYGILKKENEHLKIDITIFTKNNYKKFDSTKEFLLESIPVNLGYISLNLGNLVDKKLIKIILTPHNPNSKILVEGDDVMWVHGVFGKLEYIFNINSTKHDLLYKIIAPICFGIVFFYYLFYLQSIEIKNIVHNFLEMAGLTTKTSLLILIPASSRFVSSLLFPLVEFEGIRKHKNIRIILLSIILTIMGVVLAIKLSN